MAHQESQPHTHASSQASVLAPALVILIALLMRIAMLGVDARFHPDEALFAAQARLISAESDWLLRTTDLDKPPLTFYITALTFDILSPSELAARLPNVIFSALSVAALYALGRTLYHDALTAGLAALLLALSPYDLAFAPTVFTDIQATFWVLVTAIFATRDRWALAGIAAALMFAAKSTAIIFLPLILALGIAANAHNDWRPRDLWRRLRALAMPLLIGIALLLLWDLARAPRSFFDLGYARNNPGRLIRANELWPRLDQWGRWFGTITGSHILNLAVGIAILGWLLRGLRQRDRTAVFDWLIAGFSIAFVGWYWLIAFNTYDRYIHTLVPFLLLLAARAISGLWRVSGAHFVALAIIVACVIGLIAPGTLATLRGESTLGGDRGQHSEIDALADFMNINLSGETIYDHWLGWELAYYLGMEPDVQLRYIGQPEALADDMRDQVTPRYFVALSPTIAAPWLDALTASTITFSQVYQDSTHGFVIYRLTPPHLSQQ